MLVRRGVKGLVACIGVGPGAIVRPASRAGQLAELAAALLLPQSVSSSLLSFKDGRVRPTMA